MATSTVIPAHLAEHEDDDHAGQRGYVKGTDFALPYFSQWSRLHHAEVSSGLLRHVNCGYLSTHGAPPTLLALKQHAQSLCILIHALTPTLTSAEIGGGGGGCSKKSSRRGQAGEEALPSKYDLNDAFDFLNDLTTPYTNDDPNHNKPLMALVNDVRGRHEALGTTYHCPFAETKPRDKGEKQKPYANHHNLIMHANACLERLDHEFSATGGLMSILPPPTVVPTATTTSTSTTNTTSASASSIPGVQAHEADANPDLTNARNTLLGQWLLFTQSLVARMHDLERAYANALDALAGEAAIPHQYLSSLGPDARSTGREIAYPQDRWVLVNAGDDVFSYVHQVLDKQEAVAQARERVFRRGGVVGDEMWVKSPGGREHARGIVGVNIVTRYYRIAGQGRNSTVFVLPAWERHSGVEYTREVEGQPTVVACVQPRYPAPVSELEKRFMARINAAQRVEMENVRMQGEMDDVKGENAVLRNQVEMLASSRDALMYAAGGEGAGWAERVQEQRERAGRAEQKAREARRERDEAVEREERLQEEVEELRRELAKLRGRKSRA